MTPKSIFEKASPVVIITGDAKIVPAAQETPVTGKVSSLFNSDSRVERKRKESVGNNPTSIFDSGTGSFKRNRIQVNISEFNTRFPDLNEIHYTELKNLILTTNVEKINQEDIVNWGFELQSEYSKKIEEMGMYCTNPDLDIAKRLINEIGSTIETQFNSSKGLLKFIKKKSPVEETYKILNDKNKKLKEKINPLSQILTKIDLFKKEFDDLTQKLILYISAGAYIKNYIPEQYQNILDGRILSMETVKVQCSVNKKQIELLKQSIVEVISIIQDTITIEINNWYTNNITK